MVDGTFFYARIGREYVECAKWRDDAVAFVASLRADLVMLGSAATYDFDQKRWTAGTSSVLARLSDSAKRVYILRATPTLPFDGPACLQPRSVLRNWLTPRSPCSAPAYSARAENVRRWLAEAAGRFSNVALLDMNDAVCPNGRCDAERDGVVVFRDSQHLTAEFAKSVGGALTARLHLE
jgi:hypothetical protein